MRCLILIALTLAVASAQWTNKNRFNRLLRGYQGYGNQQTDDFETEYQPRRRLGGLHDIIGQGIYPGEEDIECNDPWNQGQCQQDLYPEDDDEQQFGRVQWQNQSPRGQWGIEDDEYETEQWGQGSQWGPKRSQWGRGQIDEDQFQDTEEYGSEFGNEIDEIGYGSQLGQGVGQCRPNPRQLPKLENINCHLATSLYKQARRERDDKNIVVSPVAVLLGLGALNVGAKGHTKKEIGLVGGETPVVNGLSALIKILKKGGQSMYEEGIEEQWTSGQRLNQGVTKIKPFAGIFLSKTTPCQRLFIQKVQGCLGVPVKKCDFQRHPQQCRQQINQWVSTKTQHKMPRLVPKDAITDNTKMLVVSGLQLKAQWGRQFKNHQTTRGVFHPLDTQKTKLVQIMQKRGVFKYHEDDTVKVLGIPTQGDELTMYVILPKCKTCLLDIEKEQLLEGDQLKRLLDNCDQRKQQVNVRLPKFTIKHKLDAKRTLLNKGMVTMCEQNTADFSGITGCAQCSQKAKYNLFKPLGQRSQMSEINPKIKQAQIHLNKFLTQATIKVTDSGITTVGPQDNQFQDEQYENEQYVQYGQNQFGGQFEDEIVDDEELYQDRSYMTDRFEEITGMGQRGVVGLKKSFNVNHPFAFVVRHKPTKQILLIGRVIDAAQKQQGTPSMGGQMEEIFQSQIPY